MPQPFSSSLMSRYVPKTEDLRCLHPLKMRKCEVDFEGRRVQWGCSEQGRKQENPRIFAMIAKISQS